MKSVTATPDATATPIIVIATPPPTSTPAAPFEIARFFAIGELNTEPFNLSSAPIRINWEARRIGGSTFGGSFRVDLRNPDTGGLVDSLVSFADLDVVNQGENLIFGVRPETYFLEVDPTFGEVEWTVVLWENPL